MITRIARWAAATLVGVAAVVAVPASPATAAACPQGTGVSVVVGNGVRCDPDGAGRTAASSFTGVGHSLTYVTTEPGFVCQVDSSPSSDCSRTPPSSAYWALWWSDGTSGTWTYSSRGVNSLKVPAGGFVAFVFGNGKSAPGVTPRGAAPAPAPTKKPTAKPREPQRTAKPSAPRTSAPRPSSSTKPQAAATPAPAASSTPAVTATPTPAEQTSGRPTATPSARVPGQATTPAPSTDEVDRTSADQGGAPGQLWAGAALALALLAGMGLTVVRRRSTGGRDS